MGKRRLYFILGQIDVVLIGMALAMFAIGGLLLWLSPRWWRFYLSLLDVRIWPPWKCIGLAVVLVEGLLIIRHWPDRNRQPPTRIEPHDSSSERKYRGFTWMDWFLSAAIAGLSVLFATMLLGPALDAWKNRPRPGMQVCRQYIQQEDNGPNPAACMGYLLYLPREHNTSRKWPLVVFLHGSGACGQDLNLVRQQGPPWQIDQGEQFPFILLSPQCPANSHWEPKNIVNLIEQVSNCFAVDPDRVYLTGYSMGAYDTWNIACYDPGRFAAIVPVAGGGDVAQAKQLVNLPIWAFHGARDGAVSLAANRAMVDAVRTCGGHAEFTVYPDGGHDICNRPFQDKRLYEWLLGQRRIQHVRPAIQEKENGKK